jgi:hypothetical protein
VIEIQLLRAPVMLRRQSTQHGEELLREMELISGGQEAGVTTEVPRRLVELVAELRQLFGPQMASIEDAFEAAAARGETAIDLRYQVAPSAAAFIERLGRVLAETDDFCRSGQHLLTLAAPPDVAVYRKWSLSESLRQIEGHPPTPWPDFARANGM